MASRLALPLISFCVGVPSTLALRLPLPSAERTASHRPTQAACYSRRDALFSALAVCSAASFPATAQAAQDVNDLSRLQKGLSDIQFLLDNWEQETTDPVSGKQDPDRVRLYMGLRTTTSPLFQIDKLLTKAQNKVDPDEFEKWIDAVEGWDSHLNKVNELAYTSSFGEYNPGGGKDQIAKYLELAREEVVLCRDSLKSMIALLPM